jgi:uncharacterized membrane protein
LAPADTDTPTLPPQRLTALADGVFAIVMTLLVFQLAVPVVADDDGLAAELAEMWPEFLIYVLSFLVLGVFWLMHHLIFDILERYDTTLIWLNILFLMFASLVPFSTRLFIEHGATTVTALVYGMNMMLVFATALGIFSYATRGHRLVARQLDPQIVRGGRRMGVVYMATLLVSMAVALISPVVSYALYGLFVLAIIAFTLLGRAETVVLLPPAADAETTADPAPRSR